MSLLDHSSKPTQLSLLWTPPPHNPQDARHESDIFTSKIYNPYRGLPSDSKTSNLLHADRMHNSILSTETSPLKMPTSNFLQSQNLSTSHYLSSRTNLGPDHSQQGNLQKEQHFFTRTKPKGSSHKLGKSSKPANDRIPLRHHNEESVSHLKIDSDMIPVFESGIRRDSPRKDPLGKPKKPFQLTQGKNPNTDPQQTQKRSKKGQILDIITTGAYLEPIASQKLHNEYITCLTLSKDEEILYTVSVDRYLKSWNVEDLTLVKNYGNTHTKTVRWFALAGSKKHGYTVSDDCSMIQYNFVTKKPCFQWKNLHEGGVWCCVVSSSEEFVFSAGADGALLQYETRSRELVKDYGKICGDAILRLFLTPKRPPLKELAVLMGDQSNFEQDNDQSSGVFGKRTELGLCGEDKGDKPKWKPRGIKAKLAADFSESGTESSENDPDLDPVLKAKMKLRSKLAIEALYGKDWRVKKVPSKPKLQTGNALFLASRLGELLEFSIKHQRLVFNFGKPHKSAIKSMLTTPDETI
jgi:hypothetical protein